MTVSEEVSEELAPNLGKGAQGSSPPEPLWVTTR